MTGDDQPDRPTLEAVGALALDRFIETFNSRDRAAWAASLSYPHVRVSPRRDTPEPIRTAQDYAASVSYAAADAMGWDHSRWDSKRILAVSPTKIHATGQWCRYDASGERLVTNDVAYVVTRVHDRWGVQARFGVDSPSPEEPAEAAEATEAARRAWSRLWDALASGTTDGVSGLLRLPFHVVGSGEVHRATAAQEVVAALGNTARSTIVGEVVPLQVGRAGVNLGVELGDESGLAVHGLFLVSLEDATPRVAAASLLPDAAVGERAAAPGLAPDAP